MFFQKQDVYSSGLVLSKLADLECEHILDPSVNDLPIQPTHLLKLSSQPVVVLGEHRDGRVEHVAGGGRKGGPGLEVIS